MLTQSRDPAAGELRLVSRRRLLSLEPGGERRRSRRAEGHSANVRAQVTFVDPAAGAASRDRASNDIRVRDAETGDVVS